MSLRIEIDQHTPHATVLACARALQAYAGLTEGALLTAEHVSGCSLPVIPAPAVNPQATAYVSRLDTAHAGAQALTASAGTADTFFDNTVTGTPVPPVPAAPAPTAAAAAPSETAPVDPAVFSTGSASAPTPPAPPVPAPASAPTAPAAGTTPASAGELDSRGFPWNERIHSSTKARLQDGSWRQMRNIEVKSPGLVAQVEAEQRAQGYGKVSAPAAPPVPAAPAAPVAPPVPQTPAAPPVPPVPPTPAAAAPVAPPVPTDSSGKPATFVAMIQKITRLQGEGMLSPEEVEAACNTVGVPGLLHLGAIAAVDATVISRLDDEIERILAS